MNKSKNKVKGKKCYYCGKLGYLIENYYQRQNETKVKKSNEGNAVLAYNNVNHGEC